MFISVDADEESMWNLQSWEGVEEADPAPRRQKLSTDAELGIYFS
jgi:hypothetical protein